MAGCHARSMTGRWPKSSAMGGDAVKVLAWYRPDAPDHNRQAQKDFTKRIGEASRAP